VAYSHLDLVAALNQAGGRERRSTLIASLTHPKTELKQFVVAEEFAIAEGFVTVLWATDAGWSDDPESVRIGADEMYVLTPKGDELAAVEGW
jgi:hypothetical protein